MRPGARRTAVADRPMRGWGVSTVSDYDVVSDFSRGHYLFAADDSLPSPRVTYAARLAEEFGEDDPPPPPEKGRGYRQPGLRLRDLVHRALPKPPKVAFMREVVRKLQATEDEWPNIARALAALVKEERAGRELRGQTSGRPRWVYWKR